MAFLGRNGILEICRPNGQQENDSGVPSPTLPTPESDCAGQLSDSTCVDQAC
jgi:hypothetical protein